MKYIFYLLLFTFINTTLFSQEYKVQEIKKIRIQGTVKDSENKLPVVGATVIVKGTSNGTVVDTNGNFTIAVNINDIILISSVGYITKEYKVKDDKKINILLSPDLISISEVAVVGYGTQERRDLTGSVTSIKMDNIKQPSISIDNALNGQVAGVQINSSSGTPGSATAITIRGITSLSADNNPLFIIDGVPVYGSGGYSTTSFQSGSVAAMSIGGNYVSGQIGDNSEFERNPLANLNSEDIESIEVLKDSYATAIYGSRGAAGVILITTKRGKKGAPKVNVKISKSVAVPVGIPDVINGEKYVEFYNKFYNEEKYKSGINTNWFDKVSHAAISDEISANVTAGTDKSNYFMSLSYVGRGSYIINNDFKRYTSRINYEYKSSDRFKFGNHITLSYTKNNALNAAGVYRNSIVAAPNVPVYKDNGDYAFVQSKSNFFNPFAKAKHDKNYVNDKRVIGNIYVKYNICTGIFLKSEFGVDFMASKAYNRNMSYENYPLLKGGSASQTNIQNIKYVINNTANINKEFGKHFFNGVLGQSFETSQEDYVRISGSNFPTNSVLSIQQAKNKHVGGAITKEWAMVSFFARLNYRFRDKYLAGVTYRLDGSSRFNKNERYVGFPSFSAGWRISEENFMNSISWIDDLKIRTSLGFSGISGSGGYYGHQGQYILKPNASVYGNTNILEVKQPSNPDLKWEKTITLDLGIDIKLLKDKINIAFDYYNKESRDMLISSAVPLYNGYSSQIQNIVDMVNSGIELTINTTNINKAFKWSSGFNIAKNKNKVTKLNLVGYHPGGAQTGYAFYKKGESATAWFLYDWVGVDPDNGNPQWRYDDGSISYIPPESITSNEAYQNKFIMGDRLPKFSGGLTNIFSYKNFELNTLISFSIGGKIMNGTLAELLTYTDDKDRNLSSRINDMWIISGHKTDIPKMKNKSIISGGYGGKTDYTVSRRTDRFLEDGSFIRLKNISLSYNINSNFVNKLNMRSINVFMVATNLFTITNYSGPDPEVSSFGSSAIYAGNDELTIPQQKSIRLGIKLGF